MISSEDDKKALDALKEIWFSLQALYEKEREEFLFFNKMRSPVKRIQNKFRYQVLMRIKSDKLLSEIYDRSLPHASRDVLVYVEEDPNNLS